MSRKAVGRYWCSNGGFPAAELLPRCLSGRGRTRSRRCFSIASISSSITTARVHSPTFEIQASERGVAQILRQADHPPCLHPVSTSFPARSLLVPVLATRMDDLTFDHIHPAQARAARPPGRERPSRPARRAICRKGNLTPQQARMFSAATPVSPPTVHQLHRKRTAVSHRTICTTGWLDYLYWDTEARSVRSARVCV